MMPNCVLMHRADSIYDDSPAEQYQFPKQYLGRIQPSVGNWVLYLEPTKVAGTRGYFAIAKIDKIIPDPNVDDMFLALIQPGTFLDFPSPVPFSGPDGPIERGLLNEAGRLSGRAQAAVRPISTSDFARILDLGLTEEDDWPDRIDDPKEMADRYQLGFGEKGQASFERPIIQMIMNRRFRDGRFRLHVRKAYDRACAFTGLRLINGSGRPEVEAAHIKPVQANGPDSIQNGIALSGTVHWMFDRGLLSLADDFSILQSRHLNYDVSHLLYDDGVAKVPANPRLQPHPTYLDWHRRHVFKT